MDETIDFQRTTVAQLYAALLDRAPEAGGMGFWATAAANGASWESMVQSMLTAPEVREVYAPDQDAAGFVASLYTTLFDRAPDASGQQFWTDALNARGAQSVEARAWLVLQLVNTASQPLDSRPSEMSESDYAMTVADRAVLANKAQAGVYFAVVLGSEDIALARQMLAAITADPASIQQAIDIADGTPPVVVPPPPPATLTVTSADSPADLQLKFDAYALTQAKVDGDGMLAAQWNVVAANIDKVGATQISGVMVLSSQVSANDALALLAKYDGTQATLDASAHGIQTVKALLADAHVQALTNLSVALTDVESELAQILQKAPDAAIDATSASAEALNALADLSAPTSSYALTGTLTFNADNDVDAMSALLTRYAQNDLHIVGTDMSATQQAWLNGHLSQVADGSISGAWTLTADALDAGAAAFFAKLDAATALTIDVDDLSTAQRESLGLYLDTQPPVLRAQGNANAVLAADGLSPDALRGWLNTVTLPVDVTGASAGAWSVLADAVDALASAGLVGTVDIPAGLSATQIVALLGHYAGTSARLDVSSMDSSALAQLQPVLGKVATDGLKNLSLDLDDALMTDAVSAALFAKASNASVDATGASVAELRFVGNSPEKLVNGGITGNVVINQDLNLNQQLNLLDTKMGATATVSANVTNLDVPALRALALRSDQLVNDVVTGHMHLNSQLSDREIGVLIAHFGGTFISAHVTGMNATAIADIAANYALFFGVTGALDLNGDLPFDQVEGLLSAYSDPDKNVTLTAPTYELPQLAQLATDPNVSSIVNPVLNITAPGATNQQAADVLAKSQNATIVNTLGNQDILAAIMANLSHIAALGITAWGNGQITLNQQNLDATKLSGFAGKLAAGLAFTVDAAQMDAAQVVALFNNATKVTALANLAIPAGVFGQISANDIEGLFKLQIGIHADLSGASIAQINKIGEFVLHLADDGLTGTFSLDHTLSATMLSRVLGKTTVGANVSVDATQMDDTQVQTVLDHLDKTDAIIGLSINANDTLLTDPVGLDSLLTKTTNAAFDFQNASSDVLDVALDHLGSFANGGIQNASLTIDASQWQTLDAAQLSDKLDFYASVRVEGAAGNETLDFSQMTKFFTVNAGAGADRIILGGGQATVELGGRTTNKSAAFDPSDTSPVNMDRIEGVNNGIKLQLSKAIGAYIDGVSLDANTTISPRWASFDLADRPTVQDLYALASTIQGGAPASTAGNLVVTGLQYSQNGVNNAYIFIADDTPGIDSNDFVIHLVGGGTMQLTL